MAFGGAREVSARPCVYGNILTQFQPFPKQPISPTLKRTLAPKVKAELPEAAGTNAIWSWFTDSPTLASTILRTKSKTSETAPPVPVRVETTLINAPFKKEAAF